MILAQTDTEHSWLFAQNKINIVAWHPHNEELANWRAVWTQIDHKYAAPLNTGILTFTLTTKKEFINFVHVQRDLIF